MHIVTDGLINFLKGFSKFKQELIFCLLLSNFNNNSLAIIACFSLNKISSFSLRGKIPGSVQDVRNKTDNTKTNNKAPIIGMAIDNLVYKYGQLKLYKQY
jgi:hypothetical protein